VEEGNALWRFVCLALQGARLGSWTAEVIRGKTGKEIARATGGTERTIKSFRYPLRWPQLALPSCWAARRGAHTWLHLGRATAWFAPMRRPYYAKIMNKSAPNSAAQQMIESPKGLFSIMAGASQADGHLYIGARNSPLSQPAVSSDFIGSASATTR
jgi:hypothetical protein